MNRVSVVGTVHEESGLANITGLLAVLDRIKPEVIFLEIPSAAFDDHLSGARSNLESTAVLRYRAIHHVDLVPVDLPTPEDTFFRDNQDLFERIERTSPEYCRLVDWHRQYVRAYGFAYLNSDHCSTLWSQLHEATLTSIAELGDHRLAELYNLWQNTNELRDKAMMTNIENYCRRPRSVLAHFSWAPHIGSPSLTCRENGLELIPSQSNGTLPASLRRRSEHLVNSSVLKLTT